MSSNIIKNVSGELHRIKAKLYQNYLPSAGGRYFAKANNEASLTIDKICASMKDRGGFMGSYDYVVENVKLFFEEMAYQLLDGFAVNLGYFSIHPNIGGTFKSKNEPYNREKHPISFNFRIRSALRNLIQYITVDIIGMADANAFIDEFTDTDEKSVNTLFVPNNMFIITGNKIKLAGEDPNVGIYFVPVDDPSKAVKVKRIAENGSSKIIGIAPSTEHQHNRIEIRTQYTGSGNTFLKILRVIVSDFIIETA
ncbi:MAG: DUF4469 domain-containing protein [Treponema sp.]|jgi:hypothetical protein|nr:DUF4469 domain-containing protein [Treponema sp.]